MKEKLTQKDVEKIQQEIDHRKLVVRKEAIEAVKEARAQGRTLSIMRQRSTKIRMKAASATLRIC